MNILNITGKTRESYKIELENSLLWECALGIAAITNSRLLDTLEKQKDFEELKRKISSELLKDLHFVEKNNTWKSLLQLLHTFDTGSNDLEGFTTYINHLSEEELKYRCLPYLGKDLQETRSLASKGKRQSIDFMKLVSKENEFFPSYIEFICQANVVELKEHLIRVMTLWYEVEIQPIASQLTAILARDFQDKKNMKEKLTPEEFVSWATDGSEYIPEPSVHQVLLIPQITYRPWTIMSDIEGTKVFYYPVQNEIIHPEDKYLPNFILTQKYKALGDEVRLRIIKLLFENDCTLNELTEQLALGKSTIHHHLKILRAATLVEINASKYCLKKQSLNSLSSEFELYLNK